MRHAFGQTFDVAPGYLNTASIGVPPSSALARVRSVVDRWGRAETTPVEFDEDVATARQAFAQLVGAPANRVAAGTTVSQLVGLVAANIPDHCRVLVATGEFTSTTFPFAAQQDRGVTVTEADVAELPQRVPGHDLVAVSVVQSADGRVVDLDALRAAASQHGVRVLLDATQAVGWLPLRLGWADWVVAAGYKWLMAPRGASWMAVSEDALARMRPHSANWCSGEDPWSSIYGLPLRLAEDARRLDLSPVWFAQVGAAATLPWLASLDSEKVGRHGVELANAFRQRCGLESSDSAIVSVPDPDNRLADAGVKAARRAGQVRLGFHLYNTLDDVEMAANALLR